MKDLEKTTNYYYNKIKELNQDKDEYINFWNSSDRYKQICDLLKVIIIKKRDYLLTDSYLDYIGHSNQLINGLVLLCNEEKFVFNGLERYFDSIFSDLTDPNVYVDANYFTFLDEDLQKEIIDIASRLRYYEYRDGYEGYDFFELKCIINLVFAYYIYTRRKDNIYDMCDIFLKDIDKTYETLYLYHVGPGYTDKLIEFVIGRLKNKEGKTIK